MKLLAKTFYRFLIIPLVLLLVHLMGLFSKKLRRSVSGRYQAIRTLRHLPQSAKPTIMIHASSLGEFEHIRPLIYRLGPKYRIIVTFFSPSGFEHAKTTMPEEVHVYLPFDLFFLWKKLFKTLAPKLLIISKHDIWPSQVLAAKKMGVPVFLVNASLAEKSSRLNPVYRFFLQEAYQALNGVFTISEEDAQRFRHYFKLSQVRFIGDTKFDQVLIRKEMALKKDLINPNWATNHVLVLGSIWPEDFKAFDKGLLQLMQQVESLKVIAVPHQPSQSFVQLLLESFKSFGVKTFTDERPLKEQRVLVVDVVGVLADLYKYATWAYVGGSFKQGIHNVMEAAVYGIPVMFGPVHRNSFEALDLVNSGGALVIKSNADFLTVMQKLIEDDAFAKEMGQKTANYVQRKTGATERILKELEEWI